MEENFVTGDIAEDLARLGFKDPCFGYFETSGNMLVPGDPWGNKKLVIKEQRYPSVICCLAPLWQQAIDFLRTQYNISVYEDPQRGEFTEDQFCFKTCNKGAGDFDEHASNSFGSTFYEARKKAIHKAISLVS
jgi:hypothetical protein